MKNHPCESCYWQSQKEYFLSRNNPANITEINIHRCRDCSKRWHYLIQTDNQYVKTKHQDTGLYDEIPEVCLSEMELTN